MNWQEACAHPALQNLPFKIELNRDGEVIMNAVQVNHALYAWEIMRLLERFLPEGKCPPEFPIMTSDNVKSPDVAWISVKRLKDVQGMPALSIAPEIVLRSNRQTIPGKSCMKKPSYILRRKLKRSGFVTKRGR